MSKQEEIVAGLEDISFMPDHLEVFECGNTWRIRPAGVRKILSYLDSKGVVIKVDRELPHEEVRWEMIALMQQSYRVIAQEYHHKGQNEMLKAGCGFFEPLIKGVKDEEEATS